MKVCVKFAIKNLWKIGLWKMYNGLLAFKGGNQQLEMLPIYIENLPNRWVSMCYLCLWDIMEMIFCPFWSCVKNNSKIDFMIIFVCPCAIHSLKLSSCEHHNNLYWQCKLIFVEQGRRRFVPSYWIKWH